MSTMAEDYAEYLSGLEDGKQECREGHLALMKRAYDCCAETHTDILERGVRIGVGISAAVALLALWAGRRGKR